MVTLLTASPQRGPWEFEPRYRLAAKAYLCQALSGRFCSGGSGEGRTALALPWLLSIVAFHSSSKSVALRFSAVLRSAAAVACRVLSGVCDVACDAVCVLCGAIGVCGAACDAAFVLCGAVGVACRVCGAGDLLPVCLVSFSCCCVVFRSGDAGMCVACAMLGGCA